VLGIAGGSCSGKTTLARALVDAAGPGGAVILPFDNYYRPLDHLPLAERHCCNFDNPDSLDWELFVQDLDALAAGRRATPPGYDFATHSRVPGTVTLRPAPLVVADGILLLAFPEIVRRLDRAVFLDVPEDVRLARRIARDQRERGRDEASVRRQFAATVAPMHAAWVQPGAASAQRVVRHGEDLRAVAAELLAWARQRTPAGVAAT